MAGHLAPIGALAAALSTGIGLASPEPVLAAPPTCMSSSASRPAPSAPAAPDPKKIPVSAANGSGDDYRDRLRPTPFGWPRLDHWCVWVEPAATSGAGAMWDQRWLTAIEAALARWQAVLPITRVADAKAAQVRILRRRPPLARDGAGRTRASHGRATLELVEVDRGQGWILEPRVQVLISPGQRAQATEATALHELGHAFGLWGHSDHGADAMAAVPGAQPVLELSPRDRATVRWLYRQPTAFGQPAPLPEYAPADGS